MERSCSPRPRPCGNSCGRSSSPGAYKPPYSFFSRTRLPHRSLQVPGPHTPNGATFVLDHTTRRLPRLAEQTSRSDRQPSLGFLLGPAKPPTASALFQHVNKFAPALQQNWAALSSCPEETRGPTVVFQPSSLSTSPRPIISLGGVACQLLLL